MEKVYVVRTAKSRAIFGIYRDNADALKKAEQLMFDNPEASFTITEYLLE